MTVMFVLKVDLGNADMSTTNDIADMLRRMATKIDYETTKISDLRMSETIRDLNGNDVGRYRITNEKGETLQYDIEV